TFRSSSRLRSSRAASEGTGNSIRPFEVEFGTGDAEAQQVTVEPVVARIRIRRLDFPIASEPLFGISAELVDMFEQDVRHGQAANDELEEEGVGRSRLDPFQPCAQSATAVPADPVELLIGPRFLLDAA